MSKFYSDQYRALQARFDARRMADLMENAIVHAEFGADEKAFIESRDMFFLSTVDSAGRPTVSYKGGAPGFVRITGPSTIAFPSYDGNGMYYSMGNIMSSPQVGLLFIDFKTPHRLRVQVPRKSASNTSCWTSIRRHSSSWLSRSRQFG